MILKNNNGSRLYNCMGGFATSLIHSSECILVVHTVENKHVKSKNRFKRVNSRSIYHCKNTYDALMSALEIN